MRWRFASPFRAAQARNEIDQDEILARIDLQVIESERAITLTEQSRPDVVDRRHGLVWIVYLVHLTQHA